MEKGEQLMNALITTIPEESDQCVALKNFLINLHVQPSWYSQRISTDFLQGDLELVERCLCDYFEPTLTEYFHKLIDEKKIHLEEKDENTQWDDAISDYVNDGQFDKALEAFQAKECLESLDLDLCSKIFYKVFKKHFDSRVGSGMMEMIDVGKKHPEVLEKMMLMEEYDDIRATLLRLQLTGKIDSLNYK